MIYTDTHSSKTHFLKLGWPCCCTILHISEKILLEFFNLNKNSSIIFYRLLFLFCIFKWFYRLLIKNPQLKTFFNFCSNLGNQFLLLFRRGTISRARFSSVSSPRLLFLFGTKEKSILYPRGYN